MSSPFTFLIFVLSSGWETDRGLSAGQVFTALAIIELLTTPLSTVLTSVPSFTAALGCFERIQSYLLTDSWRDDRLIIAATALSTSSTFSSNQMSKFPDLGKFFFEEDKQQGNLQDPGHNCNKYCFVIEESSFTYFNSSEPVLKQLNIEIEDGTFTTIIGQIGSGMTNFLKAILGEMIITSGKIRIRDSIISYCQQAPWLPNMTFREIVVGKAPYDELWYTTGIHACLGRRY